MKRNKENKASTPKARNTLLILLGFLAMGAIGGGALLMISPSGIMIGIPLSELQHSPFNSFLIPGIILFLFLGLFPLLIIVALQKKPESKLAGQLNLFKDMHWSWSFCIYQAFILIFWIQVQMAFLQSVHWLHTFYMFYAVVIIVVALLPLNRFLYKKAKG